MISASFNYTKKCVAIIIQLSDVVVAYMINDIVMIVCSKRKQDAECIIYKDCLQMIAYFIIMHSWFYFRYVLEIVRRKRLERLREFSK